jgi:hypothetical protein
MMAKYSFHYFGYSKKDMTSILNANRDVFDRVTTFIVSQYVEGDSGFEIEGNEYLSEGSFMLAPWRGFLIDGERIEITDFQLQEDFNMLFKMLNFTRIRTRFTPTGEPNIHFIIQQNRSRYYFYTLYYTTEYFNFGYSFDEDYDLYEKIYSGTYDMEKDKYQTRYIEDCWFYTYEILDGLG